MRLRPFICWSYNHPFPRQSDGSNKARNCRTNPPQVLQFGSSYEVTQWRSGSSRNTQSGITAKYSDSCLPRTAVSLHSCYVGLYPSAWTADAWQHRDKQLIRWRHKSEPSERFMSSRLTVSVLSTLRKRRIEPSLKKWIKVWMVSAYPYEVCIYFY